MKKTIAAFLMVLASATFAYPCWDQFQKDAKHTGEICDVSIDSPMCIKWKIGMPGGLMEGSLPLTDNDGFLYINGYNALYKYNITTGEQVWQKTGYDFYSSSGILYGSNVIFLAGDRIIAFDKATGNEAWNVSVTGAAGQFYSIAGGYMQNDCFPTLWNGQIVCGTNAGEIVVVDAATGATIRVLNVAGNEIVAAPSVDDDGTIYVGSLDSYFYAVNIVTGVKKWQKNMACPIAASASLDSSGVYINTSAGEVLKLSKADGATLWSKWTGNSPANGSGSLTGNGYFMGGDDRYVYKFDRDTGVIKWKVYTEDNFAKMSTIIVCTKVFIVGCWYKLVTINTDTGIKEPNCAMMNGSYTNISYWNGNLIFISNDGFMYVVGKCDPGCSACSCDSNKMTVTNTPAAIFTKTFTPTVTMTATVPPTFTRTLTSTRTQVSTVTSTRTVTATLTAVPTSTFTRTAAPSPTFTATINPCANSQAPHFTVKMVFNPEATDDIIFEITSTEELSSPPSAVICPHGASDLSAASVSSQCTKKCAVYTAQAVPGETKRFRILYPKTTGFGDIDSVTVTGTSACGKPGTSDGSFDKSVISGQDVKIFKNVIKPDQGERSIIHYKVYDNDRITVKIYNRNGQIVMTLIDNEVKMPGEYDVVWDGKNSEGKTVTSGIYTAVVKSVYYEATEKISVLR